MLIAAPYTPFHQDGSLNVAQIPALASALVKNGVEGAFVCGTTGESASLTTAERMTVAEEWQRTAGDKLKVLVHVGHAALADARALAAHAQEVGVEAVGCMAPYFFKPASLELLVDFCAEVAAAAPRLPFYFYHIPSMTGVSFAAADFLRAAAPRIPNLAGVKFTYENLMDFAECVGLENGRFRILFGRDEILLAGLALGGRGAIGSTYNFCAPIFQRVIRAFHAGNMKTARREQAAASAIIAVFVRYGGLPAGKAIMRMNGLDCGPVRLPLGDLTPQQCDGLRSELDRLDYFAQIGG
jgi:N-acetylneuraminate lyase